VNDLVARVRQHDRSAGRDLVRTMGPRLAALVRRLGLPGERDDQLQGVVTHVLSVLDRFDPAGPAQFSTWMTTVATRWLLMEARRVRPAMVDVEEVALSAPAHLGPEHRAETSELRDELEHALTGLPPPQRRAFVLAAVEGLTLPEIAACEGAPVGTIKSRLARARMALVLRLGPALDRLPAGGAP
jgi:RNA polymerase sigma-70 factor (ECF subfamily)